MSVTLLSLGVMALSTGANMLRNSGIRPEHLLKQSRPLFYEAGKNVSKTISQYTGAATDAGWVEVKDEGKKYMKKSYYLPKSRSILRLEDEIVSYFEEMGHVQVTKTYTTNGCIVEAKSDLLRSVTGFKVKLTTEVIAMGDQVTVKYHSLTKEGLELVKAIALSNPVSGIGKLAGAHVRHEIPLEIDRKVRGYIAA